MIVSVASGKGGTGKTTVAVSLALSLKDIQFLDCDVEEPNAHIFLKPRITASRKAFIPVPQVDEAKCTYCGKCRQVCAYHAIAVLPPAEKKKGEVLIFANLCHGCGACSLLCPASAIKEIDKEIGSIELGEKDGLQFVGGQLNIGEAMSPPLIRRVKDCIDPQCTVIIDAPPGTSCPMITAVKGSDVCILVTEPTPFGLNDLVLAVQTLEELAIPCAAVINRCDIGNQEVKDYCSRRNIPVLMEIPFDRRIASAYARGSAIAEALPEYKQKFRRLYEAAASLAGKIPGKR